MIDRSLEIKRHYGFFELNRSYSSWLIIPIFGSIFTILFALLDLSTGVNEGFLGFDWALYVIIPFSTVFVGFPLVARLARVEPTYLDQLTYLVETYDQENKDE